MSRACLALAVALSAAARAAAPVYTAAQIVNVSNYSPGPFAPGSAVAIFGSDLADEVRWLGPADVQAQRLPTEMGDASVWINDWLAPLIYASPTQINFLIPTTLLPGPGRVRVTRDGMTGPEIPIQILPAAPVLFDNGTGHVIATHLDGSLLTASTPGRPGEVVVVYATGMGKTSPNPYFAQIPSYAAPIANLSSFQLKLAGAVVDSARILYVGLTPTTAGLYQINIALPDSTPNDPEILVTIAGQPSATGLKMAVK